MKCLVFRDSKAGTSLRSEQDNKVVAAMFPLPGLGGLQCMWLSPHVMS